VASSYYQKPLGIPGGVSVGEVVYKVVETKRNPLLHRTEILAEVWHVGLPTPTRLEVRKKIAEMLGAPIENVYVRKLLTSYGIGRSTALVHVYDDPKTAERIEPFHIRVRNLPKEEARKILEELRKRRAEEKAKKK